LREVAAGNPVLVLQNLSFAWAPVWHYAVVMGYDADAAQGSIPCIQAAPKSCICR
jgi:hypothetical protein